MSRPPRAEPSDSSSVWWPAVVAVSDDGLDEVVLQHVAPDLALPAPRAPSEKGRAVEHDAEARAAVPGRAHRVVAAEISGMKVAGVYFASQKEKASLFDFILSKPPALSSETLIIGDFNTGLHRLDEAGATFVCTDRFERLPEIGLSDLWRRSHGPNAREYTWTSPQSGHFRLDHAFASPGVTARVRSCVYDHATQPALTDHSAMIVELDWE